jgi:hypothetical protein
MPIRFLSLVLFVLAMTGSGYRQSSHVRYETKLGGSGQAETEIRSAKINDTATGRVLREEKAKEIDIDTSPCDGKDVVRFVEPYAKETVGTVKCKDVITAQVKTYEKVEVTQH